MELILGGILKIRLKKNIKFAACLIFCFSTATLAADETFERDFDHQVQFSLKKLEQGGYSLTVLRQNKAKFERMAVFVARKAYSICKKMGYQVTYIDGIEEFDDKLVMRNKIFPPLKVKISCP